MLSVAITADGQVLASASADGAIKLWDLGTGAERATLKGHVGRVFCVDFDNKLFLFLIDTEEMTEHRKSGAPITVKDTQKPFSAYVSFDEKGAFKAKPVLRGESGSDFIAGSELVRLGANEYIALGTDNLISSHFLPVKIEISFETKK